MEYFDIPFAWQAAFDMPVDIFAQNGRKSG
jgi:hypothetical protein